MAEISRQEKLASAKKKLKQYQQRKSPSRKSHDKISQYEGRSSPFQNSGMPPPIMPSFDLADTKTSSAEQLPKNTDSPKVLKTPPRRENGSSSPVSGSPKKIESNSPSFPFHKVQPEKKFSPAEKIKQISHQLNGLISQDILINGNDPIIKEIEALEGRNSELEDNLQSFKRSNQLLSNQLNEQRKQIILLQEKLKKEKSVKSASVTRTNEQKALKEQLEIHIQTIGILVSEKTELQGSLDKVQKKFQTKERENTDTNSRLQAVRQRIVELERNLANVQMTSDKLHKTNKDVSEERDHLNLRVFELGREKEEFGQQNSELQEKLQSKVSDSDILENNIGDIRNKLHKAELVIQQLSPGSKDSQEIEKLQKEKEEVDEQLAEQKQLVQTLSSEKIELVERHSEHVENLVIQGEELQKKVQELEQLRQTLENNEKAMKNQLNEVQVHLAKVEDKEAKNKTEATHLAASEIQKLSSEKTDIEKELDIQIRENRRISKLVVDQDERIQDLESAIARMGEDAVDRVSLIETIQSDKETVSRALQQNRELKDQLEELQDSFITMTNDNAELTNKLQGEQHANKDIAIKFSEASIELMEYKDKSAKRGELIEDLQAEMTRVKEELLSAATTVDAQSSTFRSTIKKLQTDLENQIQVNERLRHTQVQAELTDRLQIELQSAQDTINQLSTQNSQLKQVLEEGRVDEIDKENVSLKRRHSQHSTKDDNVEDDYPRTKHFVQSPTPNESPAHNEYGTEQNQQFEKSLMEDEDEFDEDEDDSDEDGEETFSSEEDRDHRQTMSSPPHSMVNAFQKAMIKLEGERDDIYSILQSERDESAREITKLRQHMDLQLRQQLQQQYRQIQEHFHQQFHEQQMKLQSLQETCDKYKRQEELLGIDVTADNIPFETLKASFLQLQIRFRKLMDDKVSLSDKIQEMEHKNLQLSSECETIGEYIDLYRTQRLALKEKFTEKDRLISQLSNDHARMQTKVSQLEQLVMQTLSERSGIEMENKQLQELINKRLAIQSGNEQEMEIPKLDFSVASYAADTTTKEFHEHLNTSLDETSESDTLQMSSLSNDGTTKKIIQLFEQFHNTDEGYQKGWLSPAVRRRPFTPCKYCSSKVINM